MNALKTNRKAHFLTEWPEAEIDIKKCNWYHYFPFLDAHPEIIPHYDLRNNLDDLLLPRDMRGKSYLDIGTANGFLAFEMEKRGATVVSFDVDEDEDMEQIPYFGAPDRRASNKNFNQMFHRGYWYAHRHFKSKAKVVYGNVMRMPDDLGTYDVVMLGSILQHLRDPFVAIQCADRHVKDTLIICEAYYQHEEPIMLFRAQPGAENAQFWTWWLFSPAFLVNALKVLGYEDIQVHGPFNFNNIAGQYPVPSITIKGTKRKSVV